MRRLPVLSVARRPFPTFSATSDWAVAGPRRRGRESSVGSILMSTGTRRSGSLGRYLKDAPSTLPTRMPRNSTGASGLSPRTLPVKSRR